MTHTTPDLSGGAQAAAESLSEQLAAAELSGSKGKAKERDPQLRYCEPYYHPYRTNVKQRWIGRQILEVISTEFRDRSVDYYVRCIQISYAEGRSLKHFGVLLRCCECLETCISIRSNQSQRESCWPRIHSKERRPHRVSRSQHYRPQITTSDFTAYLGIPCIDMNHPSQYPPFFCFIGMMRSNSSSSASLVPW